MLLMAEVILKTISKFMVYSRVRSFMRGSQNEISPKIKQILNFRKEISGIPGYGSSFDLSIKNKYGIYSSFYGSLSLGNQVDGSPGA